MGLIDLPWYGYVFVTLALTHVTIVGVTVFLHRNQAHRSVDLHPLISHFFRVWLWLTTGMNTKEWTAVHRKHHAKVETEDDPHSPQIYGILKVVFWGAGLYRAETKKRETMQKYGFGTPDDLIERKLYTPYQNYGVLITLAVDLVLFGWIAGPLIWIVQMIWIPFWAAGIVNGVGHYLGYRNFQSADESRNIVPLGLLIGGEELHNNHHAYPTSSKLSSRWWEFDAGWMYINIFEKLGLARVKRVAPRILQQDKPLCDLDTLHSVIANRFHVLSRFTDSVCRTCVTEASDFCKRHGKEWNLSTAVFTKWLSLREVRLSDHENESIKEVIADSKVVRRIAEMRSELVSLWEDKEATSEQLIERMRSWCKRAEESNIEALCTFARELRGFSSLPARIT